MTSDLRTALIFARDWIMWTFSGYPRGVIKGVYDWWDIGEYFASSYRVCRTLMVARMILEDEE